MSANKKLSPSRLYCLWLSLSLGIVLLCAPALSRADSFEDAARALARKVASNLSKVPVETYSWQNRSVVPTGISERMRKAFERELDRLKLHLEYENSSDLQVELRDSPSVVYLVAARSYKETQLLASTSVPKSELMDTKSSGPLIKLSSHLFWQQQTPFLDVAQFLDPYGKEEILLVLGKTTLSFYREGADGWVLTDTAMLPRLQLPMRDLRGEIHLSDHFFQFHLPGIECDGDAWQKLAFECEESKGIWRSEFDPILPFSLEQGNNFFAVDPHYIGPKKFPLKGFFSAAPNIELPDRISFLAELAGTDGHAYVYSSNAIFDEKSPESLERLPVDWGSDLILVRADCQDVNLILASGSQDYSSPDVLQGFQVNGQSAAIVTPMLEFPGPILSLRADEGRGPIAIVLNLTSGNYEAYRITVACAN